MSPSLRLALVALLAITGCRLPSPRRAVPDRRIPEAEAAARRAIQAEQQFRPDALQMQTLGVLPFTQSGLDTTQAAIGYGLADLLRVDLGQSRQLRIVDRIRLDAIVRELQLARSPLVDPRTAPRAGRLVQARRVLYGSVGVQGNRLNIGVGIADAATQALRTAVSTRPALNDLLDAEKDMAFELFRALGVTLSSEERRAVEQRPTKNLAAFLAYGRAVRAEAELRLPDAVAEYQRAVQLDPSFALAATRLREVRAMVGSVEGRGRSEARQGSVSRVAGVAVDRLNGVFTSPLGGRQPSGSAADPAFPAQVVTVIVVITTPR